MDIGSSFTTIINKALNIDGFFPYNTDLNFLLGKCTSVCPQCPANCFSFGELSLTVIKACKTGCTAETAPAASQRQHITDTRQAI